MKIGKFNLNPLCCFFILVFLTSIQSCKKRQTKASEIKFGHSTKAEDQWLINILPGEELTICGSMAQETADAILKWASVIKRDKYLKVTTDCNLYAPHRIMVYSKDGVGQFNAAQECNRPDRDFNFTYADIRSIFLCKVRPAGWDAVLLHEVGHMWGMCDQYTVTEGHPDECDPKNRTPELVPQSIMADTLLMNLQEDDKLGITALALRTEILANEKWNNLVKLDKQSLYKIQKDHCGACGVQVQNERFCGVISPVYERWISGEWTSCSKEDVSVNKCQSCGKQVPHQRYCGILASNNVDFVSGAWVSCVGN